MIRKMFIVIGAFVAFFNLSRANIAACHNASSVFRVYRVQVQENRARGFGVCQRS